MSFIIADGGATSTIWAEISENQEKIFHTTGINPSLQSDPEIQAIIVNELIPFVKPSSVEKIYFYGAGCAATARANRVKNILGKIFVDSFISIKTDIEGAGISMFGRSNGIIAISGTGSSAGLMKEGSLETMMPSEGFPEGDFGSAAHIGALLLHDLNEGIAPTQLMGIVKAKNINMNQMIELLLDAKGKRIASSVLADVVTSKVFEQLEIKDYLKSLVHMALNPFYNQIIGNFKNLLDKYPFCYVGGTAAVFEHDFREFFKTKNIAIQNIQRSPIRGMINFHRNA